MRIEYLNGYPNAVAVLNGADAYEHPEWAAFVQKIRASDPKDEAPCLVARDWLIDHGEEDRAELIRLKLDRISKPLIRRLKTSAVAALQEQAALVAAHAGRWWPSPPFDGGDPCDRGFVEGITKQAIQWMTWGDVLYAREPVRTVRLTTVPAVDFGRVRDRLKQTDSSVIVVRGRFMGLRGRRAHFVEGEWEANGAGDLPYSAALKLLQLDWPGVTFKLPPRISTASGI